MCLHKLSSFSPCRVGYKVMTRREGTLRGEYYTSRMKRPKKEWLSEEKYREIYARDSQCISNIKISYHFGWHIYHSKRAALAHISIVREGGGGRHLVCTKVAVRKPAVTGYQNDCKVTVAEEIRILEVIKA